MFSSIGLIGAGTMAPPFSRQLPRALPMQRSIAPTGTPAKAQALAQEVGGQAVDNAAVARTCSLIFLGVKPQMMAGVLGRPGPCSCCPHRPFRAGLHGRRSGRTGHPGPGGGKYPVICLMPNTPVAVGAGVVQYYGVDTTQEELDAFQALMAPAGWWTPLSPTSSRRQRRVRLRPRILRSVH